MMEKYVKFTSQDGNLVTIGLAKGQFPDPPFRDVVPGDVVLIVSDKEGKILQKAGHCDEIAWESDSEMEFGLAIRAYLGTLR